ncbi:hypothetical protein Y5S_02016 [Alcanivorax nanhaiticus]|uniref:DUF3613 domain-containing protein n=1 Tax=Alcanivorax nanhaiticus TaxID=1177154 RepID=A0A095UQ54_9GAMM|nr:hypothetical protein [Alcanivorax nanhaiticus]KGD64650.1 hypothetical protein Y5S_02016 [Alcanivorax nanhaiticus]
MKTGWIWVGLALPLVALAEAPKEHYAFGVSDQVASKPPRTETDWLLNQQRHSRPAGESELSAPLYVDSQRRLADSFRTAIPESFGEQTRDDN